MGRWILVVSLALFLSACSAEPPSPPKPPAPSPLGGAEGASTWSGPSPEQIAELVANLQRLQEILAEVGTPMAEKRPAIQVAIAGVEQFMAHGDEFLPEPVMDKIESVIERVDQSSMYDDEIPANLAMELENELGAILGEMQGSGSGSGMPFAPGPGGPGPGGPGGPGPGGPGPFGAFPGGGVEFGGEIEEVEIEDLYIEDGGG